MLRFGVNRRRYSSYPLQLGRKTHMAATKYVEPTAPTQLSLSGRLPIAIGIGGIRLRCDGRLVERIWSDRRRSRLLN